MTVTCTSRQLHNTLSENIAHIVRTHITLTNSILLPIKQYNLTIFYYLIFVDDAKQTSSKINLAINVYRENISHHRIMVLIRSLGGTPLHCSIAIFLPTHPLHQSQISQLQSCCNNNTFLHQSIGCLSYRSHHNASTTVHDKLGAASLSQI